MTDAVRTPDARFRDVPDFPYEPVYVDWDGLRLARVEAGGGSNTVVLLHGEPTWSFLYRHVLPPLADAGLRAVAPDLPGFGRSDKPTDQQWYSWQRMYDAIDAHISALALDAPLTLVVHDWGGVAGLPWAVDHADQLAGLVILDTGLHVPGTRPSKAWKAFHDFVARSDTLPSGAMVQGATTSELPPEVVAAYDAPFHEPAAHAGALALPQRVAQSDDAPGAAEQWAANQALARFDVPSLVIWGEDDVILPTKIGQRWAAAMPRCVGFETLSGAHHFLQEDRGADIGARIARFVTTGA